MSVLKRIVYALYILFFVVMLGNTYYALVPAAGDGFWLVIVAMVMVVAIFLLSDMVDKRFDGRGFTRILTSGYLAMLIGLYSLFLTIFRFNLAVANQEPMTPETSSDAKFDAMVSALFLVVGAVLLIQARKQAVEAKKRSS
jgi:ABC-type amino acid transport system permease subunit